MSGPKEDVDKGQISHFQSILKAGSTEIIWFASLICLPKNGT